MDRISALPDEVLCHVLSNLPTKYAVATSILSTRWKHLWASVPVLDFDDSLSLSSHTRHTTANQVSDPTFTSFVYKVLMLSTASAIPIFRLKCSNLYTQHINGWITAVLRRGVQELHLCINMNRPFRLNQGAFPSTNIVFLKLGRKFVLDVPSSICFPNLKALHLDSIEFAGDGSIKNLFSSCLKLEDLIIERCGLKYLQVLKVSAPALKSLTIVCELDENDDYSTEFCEYTIFVDAPTLEYLKYVDYFVKGYSLKNPHSLIKADIDLRLPRKSMQRFSQSLFHHLAKWISTAQCLLLSGYTLQVFSILRHLLHLYGISYNFTRLELGCNKYTGQLLPYFLDGSLRLEVLVLDKELTLMNGSIEEFEWTPPPNVPECLLKCFKEIEIRGFDGEKGVLNFVSYLLRNARVLKNVVIHPHFSDTVELKLNRNLLKYLLKD